MVVHLQQLLCKLPRINTTIGQEILHASHVQSQFTDVHKMPFRYLIAKKS